MREEILEAWKGELERPSGAFFGAFARALKIEAGLRDATREAVKLLVPRLDWEAYQPHIPHGLLGLRAVFRLRPLLAATDFHRLLAVQLHMLAHEGRKAGSGGLAAIGRGSGHWGNLRMAIRSGRASIAYGEASGTEDPGPEDFRRLGDLVLHDMANVGHKAVLAHHFEELFLALESPKATGRRLLGLTAWIAASPADTFWHQRASRRLGGEAVRVPFGSASLDEAQHRHGAREICDLGLVELLDRLAGRLKAGERGGDLLAMLVLAASEKQLDARRDLEGKTSWNFVYLATQAMRQAGAGQPTPWAQSAALVNLFPTDEEEGRVAPSRRNPLRPPSWTPSSTPSRPRPCIWPWRPFTGAAPRPCCGTWRRRRPRTIPPSITPTSFWRWRRPRILYPCCRPMPACPC
ncbi:MAG: hypothetical protein IPL96_12075 [Holophagaceae bacterium]|nr:hypothetical protein [Holophagaceae bacterium]